MPPITKKDIWLSIFMASSYSAKGIDDISSIMWQKQRPVPLLQYFI